MPPPLPAARFTLTDLRDESRFRPFATLPFHQITPFVRAALRHRNVATVAYGLLALLPLVALLGYLGYVAGLKLAGKGSLQASLAQFSFGVLATLALIPPHEYVHGLVFRLLGARQVRYGAQWRRFVFYATAHRHVLSPGAHAWAALAPFVVISGLLGLAFLYAGSDYPLFFFTVYTLHAACCGGDFGLVSYLWHHRHRRLYAYDDVAEQTTYFFETVG